MHFADDELFLLVRGLCNKAAKRVSQKAAAPELQARSIGTIAQNVTVLMAHSIHGRHVDAVGDGMGALNGLPGVVLGRAEFFFLRRVPADGGGIKEHLRALKGREARALGIPLVPTNE